MKSLYGKICGLLVAGFFAVISYPAIGSSPAQTPSETQGTAEKKDDGVIRILAIGNSFSQDAVEQYLYELFDAAEIKVVIGNIICISPAVRWKGITTIPCRTRQNMLTGKSSTERRRILRKQNLSTRFWMSRGIISAFSRRAENPVNTIHIIHISSH